MNKLIIYIHGYIPVDKQATKEDLEYKNQNHYCAMQEYSDSELFSFQERRGTAFHETRFKMLENETTDSTHSGFLSRFSCIIFVSYSV